MVAVADGSITGEGRAASQAEPRCDFKALPDADTAFTFTFLGHRAQDLLTLGPVFKAYTGGGHVFKANCCDCR